jgi:hypothetical protein
VPSGDSSIRRAWKSWNIEVMTPRGFEGHRPAPAIGTPIAGAPLRRRSKEHPV